MFLTKFAKKYIIYLNSLINKIKGEKNNYDDANKI